MRLFFHRFPAVGGVLLFALFCAAALNITTANAATVTGPPPPILGNYPNATISLSDDTTVTPDATPSNTISINVSTETSFHGTFAASPMTGLVTVTDAHPAGAYTVTVTAFGPGGTMTKTFTLTVTTGAPCGPNTFDGFINAPAASVGSSISVAIGDFNGDGKQDLAVAHFSSDTVSIHLGNGSGGFSDSTSFSAAGPFSVAIGDFDGDGKQDLVIAKANSNTVSIRLGDGSGGFGSSTEVNVGSQPVSVAIGDFNGDGRQDLAVANANSNTISIRLGNGSGGFSGSTEAGVGLGPYSVAIGDFNRDGKQDLAVANFNSTPGTTVSIRLGDGLGAFTGSTEVSVDSNPYSVAIGDFNGDGKQDLAVANYGSNTVSIRLGDGLGGFSGSTNVNVDGRPYSVAILDYNHDGNQDLAVANYGLNAVTIPLGNGSGGFNVSTGVSVGNNPASLAIGDFDGNGQQDLAVANLGSGGVSIHLKQCIPIHSPTPSPPPPATPTPTPTPSPTSTSSPTPTPPPPTIVVTTTNDTGPGSLRQALVDAHNGDIIGFDPALNGQTISLTSGELVINQDITISGPGSDLLSVSRSQNAPEFRIIHIMPSHTVAIQGLTISRGRLDKFNPSGPGGGIYNEQGTVTIDSCTVSSNVNFYSGGGIANTGTLTVSHSMIAGNYGGFGGGGIFNSGTLTMMNSIVSNNMSGAPGVGPGTGRGAGISNGGTATIVSSTIDHNRADGGSQGSGSTGGGIDSAGAGSLTVSDSTISQNSAVIAGGAISGGGSITNCTISGNTASRGGAIAGGGSITNCTISGNTASQGGAIAGGGSVRNCTISGNTAPQGEGIYVTGALEIGNTVLNASASGMNIFNEGGTVTSHGYNLSSDDAGGFLTGPGDQLNTDPLLGPLQDNGGPTFTHDLLKGSPAVNTGDPNFTPPPDFDQRGPGYPRVFSGRLDIGSFELQVVAPTPTPVPAQPLNLSTRLLVQTGNNIGIGGFIITPSGGAPKHVLLRAIGPSLIPFGVPNVLADPTLELRGSNGALILANDNWRETQEAAILATGLAPTNDLESAILATVNPDNYTALVMGKNNTSGVGLVEVYDLGPTTSQLANISTRAFVGTGGDVVIGGFILGAGDSPRLLVRSPSLAALGVSGALVDPTLELRDSSGALLAFNDNCEASPFPPGSPLDACIDITLPTGQYTAILAGKNGTTGIGLLEIYNLN